MSQFNSSVSVPPDKFHRIAKERPWSKVFSEFFNPSREGLFVADTHGRFREVNHAYCDLVGYTREELLTMTIPDVEAKETPEDTSHHIEKIIKAGSDRFETAHRRKDGTIVKVEISVTFLEVKNERFFLALARDLTGVKRTEEALGRISDCFLRLRNDVFENINSLTSLCGELFGATAALYNRLDEGMLCAWGQWNVPPDFKPFDKPKGHICHDLIRKGADKVFVVRNLQESSYARTDPNVLPYKLQTYIGQPVRLGNEYVGSLCIVFQHDYVPTETDEKLLRIIASAIEVQEERKAVEDRLRLAQELFTQGPVVIFKRASKKGWPVEYASANVKTQFGFEENALKSGTLCYASIIHPEDLERVSLETKKYGDSRVSHFELLYRIIRQDGKTRWVNDFTRVVRNPGGEVTHYYGYVVDITERAQIQKELKRLEGHYRELVEGVDAVVWEADPRSRKFAFVSRRAENILGYPLSQWLNEPNFWENHIHPDDRNEAVSFCKNATRECKDHVFEYRMIKPDGSLVWLRDVVTVEGVVGKPVRLKGLMIDITERKKAEAALRNLSRAVEQAADHVTITDRDGTIEYVNPAFEKLTGFTMEEALGKTPRMLKSGKHDELFYEKLWDTILSGNVFRGVTINAKKNGEFYYEEKTITPLKDGQGNITHFISTGRDITALKEVEAEKEKIQTQLLQSQKMEAIGTLAGGIAHDFNNLLTVVLGRAELAMLKAEDSTPLQWNLKQIHHAAVRARSLSKQLLLFSRREPMELAKTDLNKAVEDLLEMLERLIGEDIAIHTHLDPGLWAVDGDEGNIGQLIMNLAVNARDAMPGGGKLLIKTENITIDEEDSQLNPEARSGKVACLSVSDTGVGMGKEIIQHIFEPFFTTKGPGKGTGLGLSVVYGIVKQHGGWINVHSEPGQGSTFRVYLPAVPGTAKEKTKEPISLSALRGSGERILVVEDEEGILTFVREVLTENGYTVFEASNAEEARRVFERENGDFDLVFSDVVLPDQSGLQLVDQFLLRKPELPVLLSSGYTEEKSQRPAISKKGLRFAQKPYTLADLLRLIRETLEEAKTKIEQ